MKKTGSSTVLSTIITTCVSREVYFLFERLDDGGEGRICFEQVLDFICGVDNRGVILAAEATADFRGRGARELPREIHGNLAWDRE